MTTSFLPFALPDIGPAEKHGVLEALESGWLTRGPKCDEFEARFADYVGASHAVAVSSCTAALHLALLAVGVKPGDLVITSPYTFAATAAVIQHCGAVPVFVDVEPRRLGLNGTELEVVLEDINNLVSSGRTTRRPGLELLNHHAHSGRVAAIIPVHLAGLTQDLTAIRKVANRQSLPIVHDVAHAFPAVEGPGLAGRDQITGGLAETWCFSFYATKALTTGEGGMVTTASADISRRVRGLSLHGLNKDTRKRHDAGGSWHYEIEEIGFKANMTDPAAALGMVQLARADELRRRREAIADIYNAAFEGTPSLQLPEPGASGDHAWHLYMLRVGADGAPGPSSRDSLDTALRRRGIGTSVHFMPLHMHAFYRKHFSYEPSHFPVAVYEYQRELSLPIYTRMSDEDAKRVTTAVLESIA